MKRLTSKRDWIEAGKDLSNEWGYSHIWRRLKQDVLVPHGKHIITVERTFQGIKRFLSEHEVEGIVFWKDGVPQCKIKRRDFGFQWPVRKGGCHEHQ